MQEQVQQWDKPDKCRNKSKRRRNLINAEVRVYMGET
jgi:hypothetical protein